MTKLRTVFLLVLLLHGSLQAGPVRVSFLQDDTALRETLAFLRQAGCEDNSVGAFQKMVEHYNSTALEIDFSKFPRAEHGYYTFQSSSNLLAVLPHRLWDIPHPFEFNCFDTVIVLADGRLRTGLHPDDHSGVFLPAEVDQNGRTWCRTNVSTARESFDISYAAWYRDATANYIPSSMADARINLTAAFYCFHMLPAFTNKQDLSQQVMNALHESWKNQAILFPSDFQVVLCHQEFLKNHAFTTTHTGLLFTVKNGYTYLEKCGGSGPFVRLDFGDQIDLLTWLAGKFDKASGDYVFVTFNDSKIETLYAGFKL
jgi:hypothetical protein